MSVSEELLAIMACPACRESLEEHGETLRCIGCGFRYPVRDGIPVMLPEEAVPPQTDGPPEEDRR